MATPPQRPFIKDPTATPDFEVCWNRILSGDDQIVSSTWSTTNGLTVDSDSFDGQSTMVWLSGGTVGKALAVNHIHTLMGRQADKTLRITIKET